MYCAMTAADTDTDKCWEKGHKLSSFIDFLTSMACRAFSAESIVNG